MMKLLTMRTRCSGIAPRFTKFYCMIGRRRWWNYWVLAPQVDVLMALGQQFVAACHKLYLMYARAVELVGLLQRLALRNAAHT